MVQMAIKGWQIKSIKAGQKVKVVWGETRKEYAAVKCYPVEQYDSEPTEVEMELPQRRA